MIALFYSIGLLATGTYAVLRGGRDGRAIVVIIATLFAASYFLKNASQAPMYTMIASLTIDCLSLLLKGALALSSRSRWPIIVAGMQLVSVCTQLAIIGSPTFKHNYHDLVSSVWAVPTLVAIALGIYLDRRYDRRHAGR